MASCGELFRSNPASLSRTVNMQGGGVKTPLVGTGPVTIWQVPLPKLFNAIDCL